jgi:hypothetical protein
MATPAVLQAALATAQASDLDWDQMALLLKNAIANAIVSGTGTVSLPWSSTSSDGSSMTRMSLAEAVKAYAQFSAMASGGIIPQNIEFQQPASGWVL